MASIQRRTLLLLILVFSRWERSIAFVNHARILAQNGVSHHVFMSGSDDDDENSRQKQRDTDPVLTLPLMEAKLAALSHDNLDADERSSLEREIEHAKTAAEFGVREAQVKFYEAFSTQDYEKMKSLWSTESHVACIHPGMSRVETLPEILKSWEGIFQRDAFVVTPVETKVDICGGTTAIVTCQEEIEGGASKIEALNIYKREGRSWKISLHMASPIVIFVGKE